MEKKAHIFNYNDVIDGYKDELEQRNADLEKARQEKLQIMKENETTTEQFEQEKQQLTEQVAVATAQAEEASTKLQEFETETIKNFEGLTQEINNQIHINSENILLIPTVEACLNLTAGSIAQMPIYLYEKTKKGKRPVENDSRVHLLNVKPNKFSNGYNLKKNMVIDYLIDGSTTVAIERGPFDLVEELYHIPRSHVTARVLRNGYKVTGARFDISVSGEGQQNGTATRQVPLENMICVVKDTTNHNPFIGKGVLETGKHILQQALHENRYLQSLYLNGAALRGILSVNGRLTAGAIERLRQQMIDNYSGANGNKMFVAEEGAKFTPNTMTPVDLEFVKSRQETDTQIFRLFGVPENMTLKDGNGNFEDTNRHFVRYTLGPILKAIESELDASLLTNVEQGKYEFKFDTSELERATEADRISMYSEAVNKGLLTINESREALDYEAVTGGDDLQLNQSAVVMDTKTGEKVSLNAARKIDENSADGKPVDDEPTEKQNETLSNKKLTEEVKHE
ncbi:phage portal protein [Bacillus sp. JJ689]|uniref:phage portal protein n=1 Tax=Bacillus sp. JJ689 TaxID=3122949 RepID=UPI003000DEC0